MDFRFQYRFACAEAENRFRHNLLRLSRSTHRRLRPRQAPVATKVKEHDMKSRIFISLSAIAVLTALLAPISVAQDATTPAKKAQPDRTAPRSGMKAAMATEATSKQPPSCAANALKESDAGDLIADKSSLCEAADDSLLRRAVAYGPHVAECSPWSHPCGWRQHM
jgi:hypothetical protein